MNNSVIIIVAIITILLVISYSEKFTINTCHKMTKMPSTVWCDAAPLRAQCPGKSACQVYNSTVPIATW